MQSISKARSEEEASLPLYMFGVIVLAHLISSEITRTIFSKRFVFAVLAAAFAIGFRVVQIAPADYEIEAMKNSPNPFMDVGSFSVRLFGAFSYDTAVGFSLLLPFLVALACAGSFAADRNFKLPESILIKGVSRKQYIFSKGVAVAVCGGASALLCIILVFGVTALFYPWGMTTINDSSSIPPFPGLFRYNPLLNDLALAAIYTLAAASLSLTGLVLGTLTKNEYIAMSAPVVISLGSAFVLRNEFIILSPNTYLWLREDYAFHVPAAWLPFAAPLYWLVFAALCFTVSAFIFLRRELD